MQMTRPTAAQYVLLSQKVRKDKEDTEQHGS